MDLELRGVELRRLADLFAGASRRPLRGELEGSVSIHGRDVESSEALDLVFGLCGVSFAPRGPDLVLTQTGSACAAHPPLAPPCSPPSRRGAAALGCLAVDDLELMGLALPPGPLATPRALLGSGPPEGAVVAVRAGEFLPQTMELERPEGRVELTWRVGAIEREGVELLLADRSLGDSDPPHERRRLTAP